MVPDLELLSRGFPVDLVERLEQLFVENVLASPVVVRREELLHGVVVVLQWRWVRLGSTSELHSQTSAVSGNHTPKVALVNCSSDSMSNPFR